MIAFIFLSLVATLCTKAAVRKRGLEKKSGSIIYITPLNIYVSFNDTKGIKAGDTLFIERLGIATPAITVKYESSSSVAGPVIGKPSLRVGERVFAMVIQTARPSRQTPVAGHEVDTLLAKESTQSTPITVTTTTDSTTVIPGVYGAFTANSLSNFSNYPGASGIERWNYNFSLNADRIYGSRFSFSNYMYLSYLGTQWKQVMASPFTQLRVYNMALSFKTRDVKLWAGRYVNNDISGVGPIDGLQAEERFGNLTAGEIAGSRPGFYSLGYRPNLIQFGGFISDSDTMGAGLLRNTLCVLQENDGSNTDRRFIYFQHTSNPITNVDIYASGEIDIFKLHDGRPMNDFSLTNLYFSAAYFPLNLISLNLSYDAQRNVIYYQSFGPTIDSLLESENQLRNDLRFETDLRPFTNTFIAFGGGYSFQQGDISPTRDANISLTESGIPLLEISTTLSYSRIISDYLDGTVFGVTVSKYIPINSTDITVEYSKLNYAFDNGALTMIQTQPSAQITTRLIGNIFLNLYYQGTYSGPNSYGMFMGGVTERF